MGCGFVTVLPFALFHRHTFSCHRIPQILNGFFDSSQSRRYVESFFGCCTLSWRRCHVVYCRFVLSPWYSTLATFFSFLSFLGPHRALDDESTASTQAAIAQVVAQPCQAKTKWIRWPTVFVCMPPRCIRPYCPRGTFTQLPPQCTPYWPVHPNSKRNSLLENAHTYCELRITHRENRSVRSSTSSQWARRDAAPHIVMLNFLIVSPGVQTLQKVRSRHCHRRIFAHKGHCSQEGWHQGKAAQFYHPPLPEPMLGHRTCHASNRYGAHASPAVNHVGLTFACLTTVSHSLVTTPTTTTPTMMSHTTSSVPTMSLLPFLCPTSKPTSSLIPSHTFRAPPIPDQLPAPTLGSISRGGGISPLSPS